MKLDVGSWIDPARGRMTFAALAEKRQASRGHLAVRSQETTRFLLDKYVIPEPDVERVMSSLTARGLATVTRRAGVEGTTIYDLRYMAASLLIAAGRGRRCK